MLEGSRFEPIGTVPDWLQVLRPWDLDNFCVLDSGLEEFEFFWREGGVTPELGPWEQPSSEGMFIALEAVGLPPDQQGRRLLLLRNLGEDYTERVRLLQKARDNLLVHEALEKEIKKKELLLHTIVHDLAGPLTSIRGAFHILSRPDLPREQMEKLLEIGVRQTEKQNDMISEILEVFAAEVGSLEKLSLGSRAEPFETVEHLRENLGTAFQAKGVGLECRGESVWVVGDRAKLERVLSNLIENALRHVSRGATVTVTVTPTNGFALVEVCDNGPGVPPEFAGKLFGKLSQGSGGGKVGLGLYFCKITIEAWGGRIGYRPSVDGGACFWFELPRAVS